jgi:hypothetical protein
VLHALMIALSLSGVPGLVARLRRPSAVVRFDRVREPRSRRHLLGLARDLGPAGPPPVTPGLVEWDWGDTRTGGGSTGARTVFFRER